MADGRPYADLPIRKMAGCYGPTSKDPTAIAAYTPNVPWAKFGCPDTVDMDGGGTSAATPQVAAAAALWMQKNKAALDAYGEDSMRVEATRKALFDSLQGPGAHQQGHVGHGLLRALRALDVAPATEAMLKGSKTPADSASFPIIEVLTGLGMAASPKSSACSNWKRCRSASSRTKLRSCWQNSTFSTARSPATRRSSCRLKLEKFSRQCWIIPPFPAR